MNSIFDGIIIGGAGGAVAGLTIWLIQFVHLKIIRCKESQRIYNWLQKNTTDKAGHQFRSTRAIASWNNLTEERVQYLASTDTRIFLSTGEKTEMWGIYGHEERSVYEERGVLNV